MARAVLLGLLECCDVGLKCKAGEQDPNYQPEIPVQGDSCQQREDAIGG